MDKVCNVKIVKFDRTYAIATVRMWRSSKEKALGMKECYSFDDHLNFLNESLAKEYDVYLAVLKESEDVVGLMATNGERVDQLYVHTKYQRQGIGSMLLRLAMERSGDTLQLFTFQKNLPARAFYEKHNFFVLESGSDNEEGLPDLLYQWNENKTGETL